MNLVLSPEEQEEYFRLLDTAETYEAKAEGYRMDADKLIRKWIIEQKGEEFEKNKQKELVIVTDEPVKEGMSVYAMQINKRLTELSSEWRKLAEEEKKKEFERSKQ